VLVLAGAGGLVMTVAMSTGGIESFAAIWLVVVPLEAALSASRRVVAFASVLALACTAVLIAVGHFGMLPALGCDDRGRGMFMAFGVASATLYAAGLAFGAESLARTSVSLLYVEEDRYRLLARNMSDVISRHRRNGAVQFISPAVEPMLGTQVTRLLGTACSTASTSPIVRPISPRFRTRRAAAKRAASNFAVRRDGPRGGNQSVDFIWVEMRCRPLEQASETTTGPKPRWWR
jgi:cell cycle sensor histidine kinase DivJ